MEKSTVIDIGIDFNAAMELSTDGGHAMAASAYEACVLCKNKFGYPDLEWMSRTSGISVNQLVIDLRGTAIYQDPGVFEWDAHWNITKGWKYAEQYLCGNIAKKLAEARAMNEKFAHCFDANIEGLLRILPTSISFKDIHATLGATWISPDVYAGFIRSLLRLSAAPRVTYNHELSTWKIAIDDEYDKSAVGHSVLNNYTYGTTDISAVRIIEQTMNAKTVKVYEYYFTAYHYEAVLKPNETLSAQEKQRAILDEWQTWIASDADARQSIEENYNDSFVGYSYSPYDGSFLSLSDLNPEVALYKHQKDAVARVLLSEYNTLLAHDVGTGKTYEMIISLHELYRMGISRKNLTVVPNSVLKATVAAHEYLYPNDAILAVYPNDFTPDKRAEVMRKIRDADYVAVYMAYSSFDMIEMSVDYRVNKMSADVIKLRSAAAAAADKSVSGALAKQAKVLSKKLSKYAVEAIDKPWLPFDKLGITTLVVDEAHNYKNIPMASRADGIVGFHTKGSRKCDEMLEKCHYVSKGGGKLVFATGTPLTNSLADLFVLQTYLQPDELEFHSLSSFDMWINTFAERTQDYEIDIDSSALRLMTRFSKFHNLTELMCLFSSVCDFHHVGDDENELPTFDGHNDVCVPKSKAQDEYIGSLSERTELIRARKVKRTQDNLLKVTTDGRKCALDVRLVEPTAFCFTGETTKVDTCAEQVARLYREHPGTAQIVFSDIGTPKSSFNVYDALRSRLIANGVAPGEIAFVHDAASETARAWLFEKINSGEKRVTIGSTQKLGIGVNVQEKLIAIHHLSVPWRPADMVQREGRIIRRGNTCKKVCIFRYITEGSFDSYSWQLLENKQRFISSFLSGTSDVHDMDDISDAVLSYAEVKALAIGNPRIKRRVETANILERTKIANRQRRKQMTDLRGVIETTPELIEQLRKLKTISENDRDMYAACRESIPNEERIAFGEELLEALSDNDLYEQERLFDTYQGFDVILPANMLREKPYVYLRSANGGKYYIDMDGDKSYGCSKRLDYFLDHFEDRIGIFRDRIEQAKTRLDDANRDLDAGNPYEEKIAELTAELGRIDRQLEKDAQEDKPA